MPIAFSEEWNIRCEATPVAVTPEGIEVPECRICGEPLTIHQPDEKWPEHLLATCGECGAWFQVEIMPDWTKAFLINLPNIALIRAKLTDGRLEGEGLEPLGPSR